MPSVETPTALGLRGAGVAKSVCRCGHCRAVVDPPAGVRRVRCRGCGWLNAVPTRVYTTCERCEHGQHVRFSRRDSQCLCLNCGHPLRILEVELAPMRGHGRRHAGRRPHPRWRESVAFTLLLYALALLVALIWISRL